MASEVRFLYDDVSLALTEAYHQRALGQKVAVGRGADSDKWHVRILGEIPATAEQMSHEETPRTTAYAGHTLMRIRSADYERLNRLRHRYMREQGRPKMGMSEVITTLLDKEGE